MHKTSYEQMKEVQSLCRARLLPSELISSHLKDFKGRLTLLRTRVLITILENCSEGDLSEDIQAILGVEQLLEKPKLLIQALLFEKATPPVVHAIAAAEGFHDAGAFKDCKTLCRTKVTEFFSKKTAAVTPVEVNEEEFRIKNSLLNGIEAAKNYRKSLFPKRQGTQAMKQSKAQKRLTPSAVPSTP